MTDGNFGYQGLSDDTHDFNMINFLIAQQMLTMRTGVPVVVKSVKDGGVGKPPTVSVQPLVNQQDGQGNTTAHGIVFGIPVLRLQSGKSAIIMDPVVGDIGWVQVADRDISAVKSNAGKQSAPGSFRHHSLADGVYIGAILNPANPEQYIQFTTNSVKIMDKTGNVILLSSTGIKLTSASGQTINLNGVTIDSSGNVVTPGEVTAKSGAAFVTLSQHQHTANNIPPTPGH